MKFINKCICLLLSAALIFGGCTAASPPASTAAMGRYVETEITPPTKMPDHGLVRPLALFPHADGSIDYLIEERVLNIPKVETAFLHYRSSDGGITWEQIDTSWVSAVAEQFGVADKLGERSLVRWIDMDKHKNLYCVLHDSSAALRLMKITPDGGVSEIPMPDWQNTEPDSGLTPRALRATENGNIGVAYYPRSAGVALYDGETGEILIDVYELSGEAFAFTDERVTLLGVNGKLTSYGADGETAEVDLPQVSEEMQLETDANGNLLLAGQKGVMSLGGGQSVFETVMEGSLYQFSDPNTAIEEMRYQPETDTFYMLLRSAIGSFRLFRYTFDPKMPRRPDTQLNVFSLHDSGTVRRAILEFQMRNPTVLVNYQVGISADSPLTQAQVIQALEAELAAGKGPDVLILDDLPMEDYAANGWLAKIDLPADAQFDEKSDSWIPTRFSVLFDGETDPLLSISFLSGRRDTFNGRHESLRIQSVAPAVIAGVYASGAQQELAHAFVQALLSAAVQAEDYNDGLPVRLTSLDKQIAFFTERQSNPDFPAVCAPIREIVFAQK